MSKLIILGNGFDLRIGLKSKFSDFFEISEKPLIEELIFHNGGWIDWNLIKDISFISFLLYNAFYKPIARFPHNNNYVTIDTQKSFSEYFNLKGVPIDWMDVESFISCIIKSKNIKRIEESFASSFKYRGLQNGYVVCQDDMISDFFSRSLNIKQYFDVEDFYDFFLKELHLFEKRFSQYLKDQLAAVQDYKEKALKMVLLLTSRKEDTTFLSFNYTDIETISGIKCINVHGKLDSEIVIGIDQEGVGENAIPFTKTFRKLVFRENVPVLTKKYDNVIIYGHSLGEQDYSYFQSVFDYLDIYKSNTVIKFVYSDYFIEKNAKNKYRIEMAKKLFKLLRSYGQTLNNKDNGQNLIHKLLLENRLIMELNNFEELGDIAKE